MQKAICAVGKWRDMTEILCTHDNLEKIDSIVLELSTKLKSFGMLQDPKKRGKGKPGRSTLR